MKLNNCTYNLKAMCFIFIIYFLVVSSKLQSMNSEYYPIIRMHEFIKKINNAQSVKFSKQLADSNNDAEYLYNTLLLTGLMDGQKIIQERIADIAYPNSPMNVKYWNAMEILETHKDFACLVIENEINTIIDTANQNNIIIIIIDRIECIAKNGRVDFTFNQSQQFQNNLKSLCDGIDAIKNNPYVFILGLFDGKYSELNLCVRNKCKSNVIDIEEKELAVLRQYSEMYNHKSQVKPLYVIEDSLSISRLFPNPNKATLLEKKKRYVRCNIEGTTGWIPRHLYLVILDLQRCLSTQEIMSIPNRSSRANVFVLHGPPGNGKSKLANIIADFTNSKLDDVRGDSVLEEYVNCGPKKIKEAFQRAHDFVSKYKYKKYIIFIDEVNAFAKDNADNRPELNYYESTATSLWGCLDDIRQQPRIIVILATNKYDSLPEALKNRIPGSNIIEMINPQGSIRLEILKYYTSKCTIKINDKDLLNLIKKTKGLSLRALEEGVLGAVQNAVREKLANPNLTEILSVEDIYNELLPAIKAKERKEKELSDKTTREEQESKIRWWALLNSRLSLPIQIAYLLKGQPNNMPSDNKPKDSPKEAPKNEGLMIPIRSSI